MPNTFIHPQTVANEALMVLEANLAMAGLVHRDYSPEFAKVGDTITIRKPASFIAKNFTGEVAAQDVSEGSTDVKLDRFRDVSVYVSARELTLDIRDFSAQIVAPAMRAIAQAVDRDIFAAGVENAGYTVAATANPTNLADIAGIARRMDIRKVPSAQRRLVLHPTHKYSYALTDNLSKVSYAGDSQTLRESELGGIYGLQTFMSQNAPDTAAATPGTATAYKVTGTAGAEKVALSGVAAAAGTVKAGDAFIVDGYLYRFAADATASSGAVAEVAINEPLHKTLNAADAMVISKPHSLAFHRNGIALVTRQLELPMGAANAAIASANGIAVRVVYDYDATYKRDMISFDVLYGIRALDRDMIVGLA